MSERNVAEQNPLDPDDLRMRDDISKIRRFILKKEPTLSQKDAHKRRKKEISQYHNRLVQEDRDDSIEAKKAYRDIRIENEEIGYCDDLLTLISMGERVGVQDEEYLDHIVTENKLLAELAQVRRKKHQVRELRDRLFGEFGGMAGRLSRERARIDLLRRAPLTAELLDSPDLADLTGSAGLAEPAPAARPRPKAARAQAAAPPPAPTPQPAFEPEPELAFEPTPAPRLPAEPVEPLEPESGSLDEDILDLTAAMMEPEPDLAPAAPEMGDDELAALLGGDSGQAKPAAPEMGDDELTALLDSANNHAPKPAEAPAKPAGGVMNDDEIAALFDTKPEPKPAKKAGPQDDIDALLAQAMDNEAEKAAKAGDSLDGFNVDEELKFLEKK